MITQSDWQVGGVFFFVTEAPQVTSRDPAIRIWCVELGK